MSRPALPAPVNGDFDIEMPDGMEACEITGAAADAVIEAANSDVMPLEPRRKVVSMEEQYRMAHPEARLSAETQRALARQNNEVKTDNLGFWG